MPGLPSYAYNGFTVRRSGLLISLFLLSFFLSFFPPQSAQAFVADRKYKIKATAGPGGSISPSGDIRVEKGNDQTFRIIPDPGFAIEDVLVDGESVGAVSSYTFEKVESEHTIHAAFRSIVVIITAEADKGGDIEPSGKVMVEIGSDQTFNIIPDDNRMVMEVKVDDESVGAVSSYTFFNVTEDHKIRATFVKAFTITPLAGEHGSIEPSSPVRVPEHSDLAFSITPDPGYSVEDVKVDMKSVGSVTSYLFKDIREDHFIEASFSAALGIQNVSIPDLPMKVGDAVTASITVADDAGDNYTLVSGSVGGYPLKNFQRITSTSYSAVFTIVEGGNNFLAFQDIPVSGLVISNGQAQSPVYSASIAQENDPIDAHSPVVTKMEVSSMTAGPGNTVTINLMADGTGYAAGPGTVVNGIPVYSDRVTFSERSSGAYVLSYEVSEGDGEVAPGELMVTAVLVDPAGNTGNPYSGLEANALEIYTSLPQAILAGPTEICEGDQAGLRITLEGRAPWDLILDDGSQLLEYTAITTPEHLIELSPPASTTYRIASVKDVNGVENIGSGEVTIAVHPVTDVRIINLEPGYALDAEPVLLEANVDGGVFSGPGVFSTTSTFHPDLAGMSASPHLIVYALENEYGCVSADTAEVYVLGSDAAFLMQDSVVCSNDEPLTVTVLNLSGDPGAFTLLDAAEEPVPGLEDHGDNTATLDPAMLEPGRYRILFRYEVISDMTLSKSFILEPVTSPVILEPSLDALCRNHDPLHLVSDLEDVIFEGPGVTWTSQDGFYFNPLDAEGGTVPITCTYITDNGCKASAVKQVELLPAPEVNFGMSSACIPEGGEVVSFNNFTSGSEHVESWQWDFGDPSSGTGNQSKLKEPTHFYQEPGRKVITLTAVTHDGCIDNHSIDSLIDNKPQADFTWISDCVPAGSGVMLVNRSQSASGTLDTLLWTLRDDGGEILFELGSSPLKDTLLFPISDPGSYGVELYVASNGGCDDQVSRDLDLRAALRLDRDGYQETFDSSGGGWTVHAEDESMSWVWGVPDFTGFNPQPGDHAWYTQLPSGQDEYQEHSWVMSPCFDFTGMERPLIRMDIMRSLVPVLNGAVLQYMDVAEEGWKSVGEHSPGINWYNVSDIIQQPGGSTNGWGMSVFDPDEEWMEVAHDLEQVTGSSHVTFRIALATNGKETMGNQGFAFDNVAIGERTKLTVLEHFTDYTDDSSRVADDIIDAIGRQYRKDVIDLQYHLSHYGLDPMNASNPGPSSTRAFNYGVPSVPYTVLDGGGHEGLRYYLSDLKQATVGDQLRLLTLEDPSFDLELNVDWGESGLQAQTIATCSEDRFDQPVLLFLVVFESSVTGYRGGNGDTHFRNVVLDMLPTPAGKLLGSQWTKGSSQTQQDSWAYQPWVEDPDELAVAAFLQNRNTSRIIQAVVQYRDQTVDISPPDRSPEGLHIYPNPATDRLYISFEALQARSMIELTDLNGRVVLEAEVPPGTDIMSLDLGSLGRGIYLVRRMEAGKVLGINKLVKIQ